MASKRHTPAVSFGLLLLLFSLEASSASAQSLLVDWDSDQACAMPRDLIPAVEALLGAFPRRELPEFEVEVTDSAGGAKLLRLRAEGEGQDGQRELSLADCAEVSQAATLLIALSIDPSVAPRSAPEPEPAAVLDASPASDPLDRAGPGLLVGAGLDTGVLPAPSLLWEAGFFLRSGNLYGEVRLLFVGPAERAVQERPQATLSLYGLGLTLRVCGLAELGRFDVGPCLGLRGGGLHGQATGVDRDGSRLAPFVTGSPGLMVVLHLSPVWGLSLRWDVDFGLIRPVFRVRNSATRHAVPDIGTHGALAVSMRF